MMMQITTNFKAKMRQSGVFAKKATLSMALLIAMAIAAPTSLEAQGNAPSLIRDTEIENIFKGWAQPILEQAEIAEDNLQIILVQSDQINAFVAGGANVFFYTGLIEKTDGPEEIIGVLAHEIGHIAGGHLIKTRDAMERASYESILGTVLGIGAAIVSGQGDAAGAIITGSQGIAQRRFLAHSRINESSADQAAYSYLDGANINASGLSSFFQKLQSQELLPSSKQSEYIRTHPITTSRIEAVDALIDKRPELRTKPLPPQWVEQHARMKAKLVGFINPGQVAWAYDDLDQTIAARYARTIAAYRQNEIPSALKQIDALITDEPENPYFHELKGQMLADFSRVEEAIPSYRTSVKLMPDAPLLRIALAHTLIEGADKASRLQEAIEHLDAALAKEKHSSRAHRLLATAYGRLGQDTQAKLHLAEEAVLQRRLPYAKNQAERALEGAKPDSREWLKAKDILAHIANLEKLKG
jgi:predicted Zn-dependent protease